MSVISINVIYGSRSVGDDDRDRAKAAALAVLNRSGVRAEDAYTAYVEQWAEHEDADRLHGAAAVWHEAEVAADLALTEGWADPCGASCSISG